MLHAKEPLGHGGPRLGTTTPGEQALYSARLAFSPSSSTLVTCTAVILCGAFKPGMGPFWLIPGDLPSRKGIGAVALESVDDDVDTEAAEDLRSALDFTGAMPHLPLTQPPTSPVNPPDENGWPSC